LNNSNTLVLGIGNTLLCDEGAGIHALHRLESEYPDVPGLVYVDGGTLSFTLAGYIEDCDHLIVFDAAELGAPPGSVKTLVGDGMDRFLGAARRSPHEVGLLDLFDIARLTEALPGKRALIGIQPENMDWNTRPSAAVERALPDAVAAARELLTRWRVLAPAATDRRRYAGNTSANRDAAIECTGSFR
jgi:hydrogenase maturation protease